jgi:hypothetical protein
MATNLMFGVAARLAAQNGASATADPNANMIRSNGERTAKALKGAEGKRLTYRSTNENRP